MAVSLLTVDLGNSAIKLRVWRVDSDDARKNIARLDLPSEPANPTALSQFFQEHAALELAATASVADSATTEKWLAIVRGLTRAKLYDGLDCGLTNRTREPERVGRDRLFAARGALECLGESALVVDAGTALTVDAVLADPTRSAKNGWRRGSFLGGAIAPGPLLLARALAGGTARLFEVDPRPDPPALGRDSAEAMRSGIGVGIRGAARELAAEIARAAGLDDPPIALTGGARAFVASAFSQRRVFESEDLVHLGLCAALLETSGHSRPSGFQAR